MENVTHLLSFAALLFIFTFYFPKQGKKGLIMNFIKGIIYLICFICVVIVSVIKLPEIGWGYSMVIMPLIAIIFLLLAIRKIMLSVLDFYHQQIDTVIFPRYVLHRGSIMDDGTTEYSIKGKDRFGYRLKFQIDHDTFIDLFDSNGIVKIAYYRYTKIVVSAKAIS